MLVHLIVNEIDEKELWLIRINAKLLNKGDGGIAVSHEAEIEVVNLRLGELLELRDLLLDFLLLAVQEDDRAAPDEVAKVAGGDVGEEGEGVVVNELLNGLRVAELSGELDDVARAIGDKFFDAGLDGAQDALPLQVAQLFL